jgi:hypothetical protein
MLSNPLNRVMLRNKTLDYFRFAVRPQNIDPPASAGIFSSHESWWLLEHSSNMRLRRSTFKQLSCHIGAPGSARYCSRPYYRRRRATKLPDDSMTQFAAGGGDAYGCDNDAPWIRPDTDRYVDCRYMRATFALHDPRAECRND